MSRALLQIFLLVGLASLVTPVFANPVEQIETCRIDHELHLKTDTQISCDGDLVLTEGAKITITSGHELQIFVHGTIHYPPTGVALQAEGEASVFVSALAATGLVKIDGGGISLEYAAFNDYDQELRPGPNSRAELVLNGQAVALIGPMLKPTP